MFFIFTFVELFIEGEAFVRLILKQNYDIDKLIIFNKVC